VEPSKLRLPVSRAGFPNLHRPREYINIRISSEVTLEIEGLRASLLSSASSSASRCISMIEIILQRYIFWTHNPRNDRIYHISPESEASLLAQRESSGRLSDSGNENRSNARRQRGRAYKKDIPLHKCQRQPFCSRPRCTVAERIMFQFALRPHATENATLVYLTGFRAGALVGRRRGAGRCRSIDLDNSGAGKSRGLPRRGY
jgi:hypothetical protein